MKQVKIPPLPEELQAQIARRNLVKGSLCTFLTASLVVIQLLFGYDYFANLFGVIGAAFVCSSISLIPFFALGCHKRFFDRTWCGEVVDIEYTTEIGFSKWKASYGSMYDQLQAILTICKQNGRKVTQTVLLSSSNEKTVYSVGDTVVHYRGTKHLMIIESRVFQDSLCVICGAVISRELHSCPICSAPLLEMFHEK